MPRITYIKKVSNKAIDHQVTIAGYNNVNISHAVYNTCCGSLLSRIIGELW